jgi:hypothetical protein
VPLAGAVFLLTPLRQPTAAGSYTSRALITALGSNGTPDPQTTAEVRFLRVVPHVLTATGRYDPKTKDAVITGRVTELGKPEPRATVEYEAASTNGLVVVLNSGSSKKVRTSAAGTFTIHKRISKTTVFVLDVPSTTGPCRGTSAAPRGCLSETTEGTGEKDVRVVVPRR